LRNNLPHSVIISDAGEFLDYLDNSKIEVCGTWDINDEAMILSYKHKDEYMIENKSSNLAISVFTTAYARYFTYNVLIFICIYRCHLYKIIKQIHDAGAKLAYVDTDSVIFQYNISNIAPILVGETLGTLTDEYPEHVISEFVASGCKSYALKLQKNNQTQYVMKAKGISLDFTTCQRISFTRFKDQVLAYLNNSKLPPINLRYNKIRNNKTGEVVTMQTKKKWQPLITKGFYLYIKCY
jgi:hypothetical protein